MRFQQVPDAVLDLRDPALTHAYALARRHSDWSTGELTSPVVVIAESAGWSDRHIRRLFAQLEEAGWMRLDGKAAKAKWWIIPPTGEIQTPIFTGVRTPMSEGDRTLRTPMSGMSDETARQDALPVASPQYDPDRSIDPDLPVVQIDLIDRSDRSVTPDRSAREAKSKQKTADVARVLEAWATAAGIDGLAVDTPMKTRVSEAINLAGVDKVERAVRGIWQDEWWAARTPTLSQALKNAEAIERFAALAPAPRAGLGWNDFLATWEGLYVAAIREVTDAPRVAPDAPTVVYAQPVTAIATVDGVRVPLFGAAHLDFASVNAAAALLARRRIAAVDPGARTRDAATAEAKGRYAAFLKELADEQRRSAA